MRLVSSDSPLYERDSDLTARTMRTRTFGSLEVSVIGLGTNNFGDEIEALLVAGDPTGRDVGAG
jgi:hypothetical protein